MTISRRKFIVASTVAVAGLAAGDGALAAEGDEIEILIKDPRVLARRSGLDLRAALLKSLQLRARIAGPVVARLLAARFANGSPRYTFTSEGFKLQPGLNLVPEDRLLPDENVFPGDMLFPGDRWFPGDKWFPAAYSFVSATRLLDDVRRDTLARGGARDGVVFFLITDAKGAKGRGCGLPTVPAETFR